MRNNGPPAKNNTTTPNQTTQTTMKTFPRTAYCKATPETREQRIARHLRIVRSMAFDLPAERDGQLDRVLTGLKRALLPKWQREHEESKARMSERMLRTFA